MVSSLEESIARSLRLILQPLSDGALIADSDELRGVLSALEFYLPQVLQEVHGEWDNESLDGIMPAVAKETASDEFVLHGACILISDQSVAPINLCLQIDQNRDEISWLECRLGRRRNNAMERKPYNSASVEKHVQSAARNVDSIDWFYKVTFGSRRV
jgi:hypothetical protein